MWRSFLFLWFIIALHLTFRLRVSVNAELHTADNDAHDNTHFYMVVIICETGSLIGGRVMNLSRFLVAEPKMTISSGQPR